MNRPTIADLAIAAGVSVSTVNRLLHGTGTLRPQTADLILSAAQQIGFRSSGPLHERRRDNLPHRRLSFLMQQSDRPALSDLGRGASQCLRATHRCGY